MADQDLRRDRISRVVDVVLACSALLALSPVMLVISGAVLLAIGRPIIFSQTRFGQGGKPFRIYKFRKFHVGKDCPGPLLTVRNDPRMSRIGQLLERTKLDELPQFFNVLRGDMNIVGPRPEQPKIFEELHRELGGTYRRRQRVLPGITGLAQVEHGYDSDLEGVQRKVSLDLEYISQRSPSTDLQIMAKTLPVMVFQKVWR